jgi:hypothetical protein
MGRRAGHGFFGGERHNRYGAQVFATAFAIR